MDPASGSLAVLLQYSKREPAEIFAPKRRVETHHVQKKDGLKVALVGSGVGWLAGLICRFSKRFPGVSLAAVHSASGARGKSYALRFKANYCTTDINEILKDPSIDVVLITSKNQYHADQAEASLRAGKDVFVEKPMAITEEECERLHRAVKESGKQLMVGFNRRFAPYYLELKKQLDRRSGPAVINARVNSPGISGAYWMADPAIGGAILGEALPLRRSHVLDAQLGDHRRIQCHSPTARQKDPVGQE